MRTDGSRLRHTRFPTRGGFFVRLHRRCANVQPQSSAQSPERRAGALSHGARPRAAGHTATIDPATLRQVIADRRLERIGLPARYGTPNPFPWMSETIDLSKEKNFFETRVTEYQSASALRWD